MIQTFAEKYAWENMQVIPRIMREAAAHTQARNNQLLALCKTIPGDHYARKVEKEIIEGKVPSVLAEFWLYTTKKK